MRFFNHAVLMIVAFIVILLFLSIGHSFFFYVFLCPSLSLSLSLSFTFSFSFSLPQTICLFLCLSFLILLYLLLSLSFFTFVIPTSSFFIFFSYLFLSDYLSSFSVDFAKKYIRWHFWTNSFWLFWFIRSETIKVEPFLKSHHIIFDKMLQQPHFFLLWKKTA